MLIESKNHAVYNFKVPKKKKKNLKLKNFIDEIGIGL